MAEELKRLPTTIADFLTANGYRLDQDATRAARSPLLKKDPTAQSMEVNVYYNSTTRSYAYTESDKTHLALHKATWNPISKALVLGSGGQISQPQKKTTDQLVYRLGLIATDSSIPMTPLADATTRKAKRI